ncbi:flagellar motor protein MotB [Ruixingdingia sedimenti]|uniref:Flagellar motor protein MotB n=1 Tax=Ruixingdingia sedimenti TaxID=3073604 RepID=A0ABU1F7W9_9RHOB|nr:flagellar motor protein MotB [Xinfangfangia sp. LG-4]MDR5652733.1 flagellar motor protein MotB [Xinfangfangia sp. LG-4]
MAGQSNAAPVIIKRKKVIQAGGHHGGAWKVAYADFVTAMMAFFLLMWLLNATTEKQRKGIADYFNPTIPVNRISGGGEDAFGGDSVFSEEVLAQSGTGASNLYPTEDRQARGQTGADAAGKAEEQALRDLEKQLLARSGESMTMERALRHVVTRITDEGLVIELHDIEGSTLFDGDTAAPNPVLRDLAQVVAETFLLVTNKVAVNGHTRAYPITLIDNPVWDLSAARAQEMRRILESAAFPAERMQRVTGFADRKPVTADPRAARNGRLEIVLLRRDR